MPINCKDIMSHIQTRILYTWHGKDYRATRYAFPDEFLRVSWVINRGEGYPNEGSGSTLVQAADVQDWIYRHEKAHGQDFIESVGSV